MTENNIDNLIPITLKDLIKSDSIEYLTPYDHEKEIIINGYSNMKETLTFYVEEGIDLKLKFFTNNDYTIIPNQPIGKITYENFDFHEFPPKFHARGVRFKNIEFINQRRAPAGDKGTYFEASESGWKNDYQGQTLEAKTDFEFKDNMIIKSTTTIEYKL